MANNGVSIHNVMCPTDFSDCAKSAFKESLRVARWFGAKITILHVVPPAILTSMDIGYPSMPVQAGEAVRQARLSELQQFVDSVDHLGVIVESVCLEGDPVYEIREAAQRMGADLLVMGTHGRSGFGRLMLGSVTESVLACPPVPVLTVHRDSTRRPGPFRRILCAADAGKCCGGTIGFAVDMAGEGAEHLTVLHVVDDIPETRVWVRGHFPSRESGLFREDLERAAIAELQKAIPDESRVTCRIEEHVAFGPAADEIMRVAGEEGADLIVLGNRGRNALDRLLVGSTARRVVRAATCPVLVVPTGHAWPATGLLRKQVAEPVGAFRKAEGGGR